MSEKWLLVNENVLPEVFTSTVRAKRFLLSGEAKSSSEAARMAGISRSAFYKYKDCVLEYDEGRRGRIVNFHAVLADRPGVLSALIFEMYENGANVLTLNQNIPTGGTAPVSISIRTDNLTCSLDELTNHLSNLDGVKTISQVVG